MTTPTPLDAGQLRSRLVDSGPYEALDVVTVTGSTNSDLLEAAGRGAADRTVLLAEEQRAGRGRSQRSWVSPRGYGLHVSVLLRPSEVPASAIGWLPLICGVALADAVAATGLRAALKWPNDLLLADDRGEWAKAAGILADGLAGDSGMSAVLGIGVNVLHGPQQLPTTSSGLPATSLAARGAEVDRAEFAVDLLARLAEIDRTWRAHGGDVLNMEGGKRMARSKKLEASCEEIIMRKRNNTQADMDVDVEDTQLGKRKKGVVAFRNVISAETGDQSRRQP